MIKCQKSEFHTKNSFLTQLNLLRDKKINSYIIELLREMNLKK